MGHAGRVHPSPPSTLPQTSPRKTTPLRLLPKRCHSPQGRALRRRQRDGSAALPQGCASLLAAPGLWLGLWRCMRLELRWLVGGRWWSGGTLLVKPHDRF